MDHDLVTICRQFIRYQHCPAYMFGHRVNIVYHFIPVQPDVTVKIASEHFHCVNCKLMGSINTMQEYTCRSQEGQTNVRFRSPEELRR